MSGLHRKTRLKSGRWNRKPDEFMKAVAAITATRVPAPRMKPAKAAAWMWFSRFIRLRGRIEGTDKGICITCGRVLPIYGRKGLQAGHFIPGRSNAGNAILYSEEGVQVQCPHCNISGGEPVRYEHWLSKRYGAEMVEELKALRHKEVQMTAQDHLDVAAKYKAKCQELGGWEW